MSYKRNSPIPVDEGGTGGTILTDNGVLVGSGSSAMTSLAVGADGYVLLGATGADPAFAALTSSDGLIDFSLGANTLDITLNANAVHTALHGWNGSLQESSSITVTSNGTVITFSIEKSGSGDLTVVFSDGYYEFDTTPAATIALNAGSDTSPQINYVYLLQSTKTLTVSTVGWPIAEHAPFATVLCQSAASLQSDGAYKVHAWSDHVTSSDEQGHIGELNFWIRAQNATWVSGVGQTLTITTNGASADNVIFTSASGIVLQLHEHVFPAFTGTPDVYTVNDLATPYNIVTDLNALLTDSAGGSMSGSYFSLVIWGVVSEATGDCKLMVNLPGGSYGTEANLIADPSRYANFSIPAVYTGTGFLIAELQLRHQSASSGTWTEVDVINLLGIKPSIVAGGGTVGQVEFSDNAFRIFDNADNSKEIEFQVSGLTSSTTRTLTVQDADGTLALSDVANYGTGVTSNTAYAVLCGGTTSTNPIQSIASVGTSGQILTSNGAGALPTFQAAAGGGIATLAGDSGSATGSTVTLTGGTSGLVFTGATATMTVTADFLAMPTTTATDGQITVNGSPVFHIFGTQNTFVGQDTGNFTMSGAVNIGIGYQVLRGITSGNFNIALGRNALDDTTTGGNNVAIGDATGQNLVSASNNVIIGSECMTQSTGSAHGNVSIGKHSSFYLKSARNVAIGLESLNTTSTTGMTGASNIAIGAGAINLTTALSGTFNVVIGDSAGTSLTTTDSDNIYISNSGAGGESNALRIGAGAGAGQQQLNLAFIHGIRGITTANADAVAVLVDSAGQLGTVSSSIRYKENVSNMEDVSSPILNLRPVTFDFIDKPSHKKQVGLIAEEVDKIMPELVARNQDGDVESVKYHDLPVLLLNELQKALKRIDSLEAILLEAKLKD